MAKYSYEFKRKFVQAYLNGEGDYSYLAKKYNISAKRNIEAWMHTYKNLKEKKIFQSMSRKGNCYDNSVMENFFGILKQEMYYGTTYYSFDEMKTAIEKYIKYYSEKRIKEKLGRMSPVQYRLNVLTA